MMGKTARLGMIVALAVAGAGMARAADTADESGVLSKRYASQENAGPAGWVLQSYRPCYILPVAYGLDVSDQPLIDAQGEDAAELQDTEIKFQFSFKVPVWEDMLGSRNSLYAAYTQLSMWQAYNADESSPFRDTNYEPEFFGLTETDFDMLGLKTRA
ncbi:MAG TPA: phospholipase A, partial [Kiritimatiellia bacterium]